MVIRRVGPLSCAKIAGVLYAIIGFVVGGILSLVSMAGAFVSDEGAARGALLGIGAIIALPILYGVLGFVMTAITAMLYNGLAGVVGGVELDVQ